LEKKLVNSVFLKVRPPNGISPRTTRPLSSQPGLPGRNPTGYATKGHMHSYTTSYYTGSKCHTGTQA